MVGGSVYLWQNLSTDSSYCRLFYKDPMPDTAPRLSLAEEAYREISDALLSGALEPGQRLSEPELALRFHTSRSPVREALARLEHEGFVERAPSGRLRVAALDI